MVHRQCCGAARQEQAAGQGWLTQAGADAPAVAGWARLMAREACQLGRAQFSLAPRHPPPSPPGRTGTAEGWEQSYEADERWGRTRDMQQTSPLCAACGCGTTAVSPCTVRLAGQSPVSSQQEAGPQCRPSPCIVAPPRGSCQHRRAPRPPDSTGPLLASRKLTLPRPSLSSSAKRRSAMPRMGSEPLPLAECRTQSVGPCER